MTRTTSRKKLQTSSDLAPNKSESKYAPPELWTLIFATSPVKTLARFRSVCKLWCSIIDDPDFVHMHAKLRQSSSRKNKLLLSLRFGTCDRCLLTVLEAETLTEADHIYKLSEGYTILGSCNGLILVRRFDPSWMGLRVWNPSIRKSLIIPRLLLVPITFEDWYVIGFAPSSKKYKVAAFVIDELIGVYTLGEQQWVQRYNIDHINVSRYGLPSDINPIYFEGATYWLGRASNEGNEKLTHLVSFNFDTEKFALMKLPYVSNRRKSSRLFLLDESLAIFCISSRDSQIWVLEQDDGEGTWTLRFSGQSSPDGFSLFRSLSRCPVFYVEKDGGCFLLGAKSYNIHSCQVKEVNQSMSESYPIHLEPYSESLMLCCGYGATQWRS